MADPWQNRIVGYSEESPDQLLAHPLNFRVHPKHQQDALAGVLSEVGIVQNILCNRRTQTVIDGHLRIALALRQGQATVPVTWVDLSEEEEALVLVTLDPISAMAATDKAKLGELLESVSSADAAVMAMLDQLAQEAGLVPLVTPEELWQGMPDFEQEDLSSWKSINVHFANGADYEAFSQLVEQQLTQQTKFMWYPRKPKNRHIDHQVIDES